MNKTRYYWTKSTQQISDADIALNGMKQKDQSKVIFGIIAQDQSGKIVGLTIAELDTGNSKNVILKRIRSHDDLTRTEEKLGTKMVGMFCQIAMSMDFQTLSLESLDKALPFYRKLKLTEITDEKGDSSFNGELNQTLTVTYCKVGEDNMPQAIEIPKPTITRKSISLKSNNIILKSNNIILE